MSGPRAGTALAAGLALVASVAAIGQVPNLALAPRTFLALFGLAAACYAVGLWALRGATGARAAGLVLMVAVATRLVLLPAAPTLSTDAYRYVWDARVAQAGVSPYAHPPSAPELEPLRDGAIYPRLNHPTWITIYPPAAQALFGAVYALAPDSVHAMKLAMGAVEVLGLAGLFGLLGALGLPLSRAAIYAWNPLVLIEIWGSAHLDAVVVAAVTAAAWAESRGRHATAGALVGLATAVKLYPGALFPLLVQRGGAPAALAFGGALLVGYLPVWASGLEVLGSLPRYLAEEHFNPGLVRSLVDVPWLSVAVLAAWALWTATRRRTEPLAVRALPLIAGSVVVAPSVFPWYAVWLVPFLAIVPSPPWIAFTASVAAAYAFFIAEPWAMPPWARALEAAPLALGAIWWCAARRPVPACSEPSR